MEAKAMTDQGSVVPQFRAAAPSQPSAPVAAGPDLGLLSDLTGTWQGAGFSLIARPNKQGGTPFVLQLNATQETLAFTLIGAPIANRGSLQDDIDFLGLHYLQQISDAESHGSLHLEPGLWLNLPATTVPPVQASVVRLGTVPHGGTVLAQGSASSTAGAPSIPTISTVPLNAPDNSPLTDATYLQPYSQTPPPGLPATAVTDPSSVLKAVGGTIVNTTTLSVSTKTDLGGGPGTIGGIPFVNRNANVTELDATFWIEEVQHPETPGTFLQLQYAQTVMLEFDNILWPHVSVATLVKQ